MRFGTGSICGSDLHYSFDGCVGVFRIREPMFLGNETSGDVIKVGPEFDQVQVGQRVAVNPLPTIGTGT